MSKGCHQLIKQGAKLVDDLQDIVEELGLSRQLNSQISTTANHDNAANTQTGSHQTLLDLMGFEPIALDRLVHLSDLTVSEVSSMLMLLELEGSVASIAGGNFQRIV